MKNIQATKLLKHQKLSKMKTVLPAEIKTIEQAKTFLTDLYNNGESFHPEDSAHDIVWGACETPSFEDRQQLDVLMESIYDLPGNDGRHINLAFCPCGFLLDLDGHIIEE